MFFLYSCLVSQVDAGGCNSPGQSPGSPVQLSPVLVEAQICRLAEAAHHLVNTLLPPQMEPKAQNAKRKMSKDLEQVLSMSEEDPKRMELIRKYAAIYGRFDCKRKPEKPLTLHEVSVNEAAAQICRFVPALLTRRDELFPLARQVVRDSGYHYSKGHSKSYPRGHSGYNGDHPPSKRQRFDNNMSIETEETIRKRQERLDQIAEEIRNVSERTESLLSLSKQNTDMPSIQLQVEALQTRHQQLLLEQSQLVSRSLQPNRLYRRNSSGKLSCVDSERPDTDDTDSQLSYSNTSSPLQEVGDSRDSMGRDCESSEQSPGKQTQGDSEDEPDEKEDAGSNIKSEHDSYDESFYQENKVKVIASSGGNIIAVANPALSMSPAISIDTRQALLKKETLPTVDPKVA
ncbi:hypothetical protein AAG570_002891 [Ranatra chinensis]|uniref:NAB co-repressor domain-containing protein n=1 Tax=Ranatra chinensis TaxID=642074 RepID=A0ABD0Y561_9HEMI